MPFKPLHALKSLEIWPPSDTTKCVEISRKSALLLAMWLSNYMYSRKSKRRDNFKASPAPLFAHRRSQKPSNVRRAARVCRMSSNQKTRHDHHAGDLSLRLPQNDSAASLGPQGYTSICLRRRLSASFLCSRCGRCGRREDFLRCAFHNAASNRQTGAVLEVQINLASRLPTLIDTPVKGLSAYLGEPRVPVRFKPTKQ